MHSRRLTLTFFAAAAATSLCLPALAQKDAGAYPTQPIRLVVPYTPGGTTDILARVVGQKITEATGQPVVVENKPGAGGSIGADYVAKAKPDGYTLVMATVATHATNASLFAKMPYDHVRDFEPVSLVAKVPNVLVAHPSVSARDLPTLIADAKKRTEPYAAASTGIGGSSHLSIELLQAQAGIKLNHIAYRGSAPAASDLLSGQVPLFVDALPTAIANIRAKKFIPIAVTSQKRSPALGEVPAAAETLPGFESVGWYGILAPANTPKDRVDRLSKIIAAALQGRETRAQLIAQGNEPIGSTPGEFRDFITAETKKWSQLIKSAGIKLE